MAMTAERRTVARPPIGEVGATGFRPPGRRRARLAVGLLLAALAVVANLLVYSNVSQRRPVLQVVRDVPAGSLIGPDDIREVEVAADPTVRVLDAEQRQMVVGSYARVRLVSGSLVVAEALQTGPLVAPGAAVIAVQVPDGALPVGVRERSRVRLVVPPPRNDDEAGPVEVDGWVVGLPSSPQSVTGRLSLSVEVAEADATRVVTGDDVRVVLLDPAGDPVGDPAALSTTEPGPARATGDEGSTPPGEVEADAP